ncbi:MAG TPA: LytTR family DNA-binding domain-containing protein [Chitinophagaceae bacterium]|jgi:two-component system LytT family response regulator|nr:LytTR family DNA-binding domain-containing protein [Chitinophagaceae bacterium]
MKIATLIIDDDPDSRMMINSFLEENSPDILNCGECSSVSDALGLIKKYQPDLLLLDISLPDGTAFDLLRQIPEKNFEVIFITAYEIYAVEAFRFSAVDFLLKPVLFDDMKEALEKVSKRIGDRLFKDHWVTLAHNLQQKNLYERRLAIATANGFVFVDIQDIVRLESHSNYTHFYFAQGTKTVSSHTLGYYEELLPVERFCRIHNSHLVNIDFIERYTRAGVGGTVLLKDGTELTVSQRKKEIFFKHLVKNS